MWIYNYVDDIIHTLTIETLGEDGHADAVEEEQVEDVLPMVLDVVTYLVQQDGSLGLRAGGRRLDHVAVGG